MLLIEQIIAFVFGSDDKGDGNGNHEAEADKKAARERGIIIPLFD